MGELCMTCNHLGERCGYSGYYCDRYEKAELTKEEKMENAIIKASRKAGLTRNQLLDTLFEKGVLAVYNLGMQHMYEYLEE